MHRQFRTVSVAAYALLELVLTAASFGAAVLIRRSIELPGLSAKFHEEPLRELFALTIAIWIPLVWRWGLSHTGRMETAFGALWKVVCIVAIGSVLLFAVVFATRSLEVSRSLLIIFAGVDLGVLGTTRVLASWARHYSRRRGHDRVYVLIAGTGGMARAHAAELAAHPEWGVEVVGFLTERAEVKLEEVGGVPVLGSMDELPRVLADRIVDEVHVAASRRTLEKLDGPLGVCDEQGIGVRIVLNQLNRLNSNLTVDHVGGVPILSLASVPQDPVSLILKRAMDIAVSLVALLISMPLFILPAMVLIKVTSPGPLIFRQKRVGRTGRNFTLYKLRTMRQDAEQMKASLMAMNEVDGPVFKIKKDPRITAVGRILRKLSIDELPQLWNVLRGDMSLVGPRPPLPAEVAKYERWQRRRLSMRPGITCIWQVSGRSSVAFNRWMEMDLEYIDNWSLGLDLKILLKTIPSVFMARGAS
jgi:exopolysaccharide biosynthesis polyprenyl glycosylphosphotransferase